MPEASVELLPTFAFGDKKPADRYDERISTRRGKRNPTDT